MDWHVLLYVLAGLLILVGLVGILLPLLPGVPLMFAGMLLAAWADGFRHLGWGLLSVLAALTLLSMALDFWATAQGAKRVGASRLAMGGAALGTLVGLFFGLPGLLLGPFIGALVGELLVLRSLRSEAIGQATKVGAGTWIGLLIGIVLRFALAFAMLGLFAFAWWI